VDVLATPVAPIDRWALSADLVHLNHGSYGGCPHSVLNAAASWRTRMELAPMRFFVNEWQAGLDEARAALATFVRVPDSQLVFAANATTGIATALASIHLDIGDDILTTSHVYRACRHQLLRLAAEHHARLVIVEIPLPFDPQRLVDDVTAAITPRTRVALLDHITSPTALVLPIAELVAVLAARGVQIIIDGAHAPGQIPLDVGALLAAGVTYYAGNCHKWICAPKGAGFLIAAPDATGVRPLVTSHGAAADYGPPNRFHAEHDWAGTHDPSPFLAVPVALAAIAELGGGWPATIARNHALAVRMRERFVAALLAHAPRSSGAPHTLLAADDDLGTMAAIEIALPTGATPFGLQQQLLLSGWEVPIVDFPGRPLVRLSAHLYNHAQQADDLAAVLGTLGVTLAPQR
jgi:isopenicillin-N epimerase